MATIVTRASKLAALTTEEMDDNFTNLKTEVEQATTDIAAIDVSGKLDAADGTATGTLNAENITATGDIQAATGDIAAVNLLNTVIRGKVQNLGDISGIVNIDTALGDTVTCKITGNTTFTVSNLKNGSVNTIYLVIENIGAGSITWPGTTTFNRGAAIQTNLTGKTMIILDTVDAGITYMGVQTWRDYA